MGDRLKDMTNAQLLDLVRTRDNATDLERELARRLSSTIDAIKEMVRKNADDYR